MWKLKIILLVLMLFSIQHLLGETALIDSLQQELKKAKGEDRYEILHDLGWQYRKISTEKALEYENAAMDMAREWGDSLRVARSLYHLARIYSKADYEKAVILAERSIRMIEKLDESNLAKYYLNLGYIYEENYHYEEALKFYLAGYNVGKRWSNKHDEALLLEALSDVLFELGNYLEAVNYTFERLEIWLILGDKYEISKAYFDLGRVYLSLADYRNSHKYYIISKLYMNKIELENKFVITSEKTTLFINMAKLYIVQGQYYNAIRYLKESLKLLDIEENYKLRAYVYNYICNINIHIKKYHESIICSVKAIMDDIISEDLVKLANSFNDLGQGLMGEDYYDLSFKCLILAKDVFTQKGCVFEVSTNYNYLGEYYYKIGDYKKSIKNHYKALKLKRDIGDKRGIAFSLKLLGQSYLKTNQLMESRKRLTEAFSVASKINERKIITDVYVLLSELSEKEKNFHESIKYLKLYESYQDSIFSLDKLNAISQMDVEIKNLEKQKELEILEQENELIKADLEKEKYSRIKLAVLVGALIILTLLLILYSRSLKRTNARLEKEIRIRKSSETELQELKAGLEQQVVDRTAQLQQINEDLHDKIIEKTQSQNVLLEAEKMAGIGQMAAGIAHEIRNPIAIIRSTAQFLSGAYSSTQDSMKILTDTSDDINRIITRLMNFTKLKPLKKEMIDLNDFFREISTKFEHQLHESGIKMVLELQQNLPVVKIDPDLMTNMISELITNSIEALSRGGSINVSALKRNGQIEISIEDNGKGIKDIEQAIRSFYSTKKKHPGLGFNYVRYIAGLHDFTFNLESILNKGTRARIII